MAKPEILAPCGSMDALLAALRCGANAVYLGLNKFSARSGCENFDFQGLLQASKLCAVYDAKLYVAFNTLVSDDEIDDCMLFCKKICQSGVDAVIVQDLGLAALIRQKAPDLALHASTQMSVHTAAGANLLLELGYSTFVLPREMRKNEIASLHKNSLIRLEAFVHGALCMCVSGQCYMSSMIGGRSGNRGMCAQPCRLPFSSTKQKAHDLSLKDLSLLDYVEQMQDVGVESFKIEGRMKRPEYVAAAVMALNDAFSAHPTFDMKSKLEAVFSRSGFTDGYFANRRDPSMFGIRTKQDVISADNATLKSISNLYQKPRQCVGVNFIFEARLGKKIQLRAFARGREVTVFSSDEVVRANSKPATVEIVETQLQKCGGTLFLFEEAQINIDDNLFIPLSTINRLRQRALDELLDMLSKREAIAFDDKKVQLPNSCHDCSHKGFIVRLQSAANLPSRFEGVKFIVAPLGEIESVQKKIAGKIACAVELPRVMFGKEDVILAKLQKLKEENINFAFCNSLDALCLAKKANMQIIGGFGLNVFNSYSANVLKTLGASILTFSAELTANQIGKIKSSVLTASIAYGKLPLMVCRNCPVKNQMTCAQCRQKGKLIDRMNKEFDVQCSSDFVEILNSCPIYMGDRLNELQTNYHILYFSSETADEADAILDLFRNKLSFSGQYTRGLYYRGVK